MKHLPLYPGGTPRAGIENIDPVPLDHDCEKCQLSDKASTVCMAPAGRKRESGPTLLYISDYPSGSEDRAGKPMAGRAGILAAEQIRKHWHGSFIFDNVIKCNPGKTKVDPKMVEACAPYARHVIEAVKPDRIIASGRVAIRSIFGRDVPPRSVRKGYGWLSDDTPVFLLMSPEEAARNKFVREWFEEDLEWALTVSASSLRMKMPWKAGAEALFIESPEEAVEAVKRLRTADILGFDTETAGRMYDDMAVFTTAVAADNLDDVYVWEEDAMRDPAVVAPLLELLGDPDIPKVAHNEIWDRQAIYDAHDVDTQGMHGDTGIWAKIIDPEVEKRLEYQQNLVGLGGGKELAEHELARVLKAARPRKKKGWDEADVEDHLAAEFPADKLYYARKVQKAKNTTKAKSYAYALFDSEVRGRYCGIDALSCVRLAEHQEPLIFNSPARTTVWSELMGPGQEALMYMQRWGCPVDQHAVEHLADTLTARIEQTVEELKDEFGDDFNPNSTKQVSRIMFEELGLPILERTATNAPCTDEKTLKRLAAKHWFPEKLLQLRGDVKLLGYPKGWPEYIMDDGRFHPKYKIDGARSGRPSCEDPNLFNIPRADNPDSKPCRDCIQVDSTDDVCFSRDLSQAELRVMAALSGDQAMKQVFIDGHDFHLRTAQMIAKDMWDVKDWSKLSPSQQKAYRSQTKPVNFGLAYGKTVGTLAKDMKVSVKEAQKVVDAILGSFPDLSSWMHARKKEAKRTGGIWVDWPLGTPARWRPLPNVASKVEGKKITALNGAVNTPIQGFASDICLDALIRVVHWCRTKQPRIRVILTVYDSIIFQVPKDLVPVLYFKSKSIMERVNLAGVPMVSDPEIFTSWGTPFEMRDDASGLYVVTGKDSNGNEIIDDLTTWLKNC